MKEKVFEWQIEITDEKGEFKKLGIFTGTSRALTELRKPINVYVDTEEGFNTSYRFTKL